MTDLIVNGGRPISGTVRPSGNKNAVLPMLCASILTDEPVTLENVPEISDIDKLLSYFAAMGSTIDRDLEAGRLTIRHDGEVFKHGTAELPVGIRAAVLLLGPVLWRNKSLIFDTTAKGCALGVREIDPHLEVLEHLGGRIASTNPLEVKLDGDLTGAELWPDYASVTATETFAMTAALAKGVSTLTNAASEPHVQALCDMLTAMGAKIEGAGTSRLTITGVEKLGGVTARVPDDHHEVATYLAIGGVTGGRLTVETDMGPHMPLILRQFEKLGMSFDVEDGKITVTGWSREIAQPHTLEMLPKIEAAPWPYFPADLLPQAIGVSVGCKGDILFWNKVYEGALGWCSELLKFGARAHLSDPHRLIVCGGNTLRPATVEAPYIIRVVPALLIAAMQIEGQSTILHADPLRRAYPHFVEKLTALGAEISWR
ncbi:UDP-N-acetylglucosamine 1-carboxyvinyltransferase [Agrobacterium larrymoorei]|uniref:UDP-N-acetylglucosamine 1-carboxyvinyltransferase n=1 Tax=Agrobacterium larrymoorei TaxID=160699 RepID=A0A4D7DM66_9HYPH|nr:UDP-N-acetylglucosamine 1-carboxyvinyltransferase [Agrobacterium larrymoorei]QCI97351.1 UDP-N-acetylglucosamine 1-carboxyvinyltransferase [Agrobacterium larrymoorei]QYA07215.1 UDP-N-acetylglucosamine 1-carboxyvinyltransferase [Agrobacterium larrymoorei]